jgi:predicted metal-dependent enzyme (double-stranded beta helix superfamily)
MERIAPPTEMRFGGVPEDLMFDVDELVSECVAAGAETEPRLAVRDVLTRALARPDDVAASLRPTEGGISLLHHTPDLTVIHVVWAPGMRLFPHNHLMWAAIGIYAGQEDNTFYRRTGAGERALAESGGKELTVGDVVLLGDDTIHAVANPKDRLTGAIHVYGGDFIRTPRSQWDATTLEEAPWDLAAVRSEFERAEREFTAGRD